MADLFHKHIFRLTTNYMTPVLSAEESSLLHVYHPQMMLEACYSHHAINCTKIPQSEDEKVIVNAHVQKVIIQFRCQ